MTRNDFASGGFDYDVIVVGAGFAGLNALYRLRERGLNVRVLEAGSGVGGTWYWNRYPGARVDIESLEYSYAFMEELQQEWSWPARYSEQPDVLRYLEWVADRLDLRKDIEFSTRVESAGYDESHAGWTLCTDAGERLRARFCVMAVGFLSAPYWPEIPGRARYQGQLLHTGDWPREGVDLGGRRVGVIGAGATTVQLAPRIAPDVAQLVVFQRTPNWCFPMNNMPMPEAYERHVKSIYPIVRREEHQHRGAGVVLVGFELSRPSNRRVMDVSPQEREQIFEKHWSDCALHIGSEFSDLLTDEQANRELQRFIEKKIRTTVQDPQTADLLIPKNHPPMTRRPCGEDGYYEAFNRPNVTLVDALDDPIAAITETGIRLESGRAFALDVIVCATGFDAGTGGLTRIDIRGVAGRSLKEYWSEGARTHLGMMSHGFPNMFFLNAVQSPSAFFSPPLLGDYQSGCVIRLIDAVERAEAAAVEPVVEAEGAWVEHVNEVVAGTLLPKANSWWMGANIPGKPRQVVAYAGGFPEYEKYAERALENLAHFSLIPAGAGFSSTAVHNESHQVRRNHQ